VRERRWHVAAPCLIGAAGFVLTVLGPATPAFALATLSIAAFGIWGTLGPFWTLPTNFLRGTAAAGGIALVNSVGNVGRICRAVPDGMDSRSDGRLRRRPVDAGRRARLRRRHCRCRIRLQPEK
jgi:ACS family tartrate transporter-like MFS transporter